MAPPDNDTHAVMVGARPLIGQFERCCGGEIQHLKTREHDDGDLAHDVSSKKFLTQRPSPESP